MSTLGLFHYPATILDDASLGFTTTEIAKFGAAGGYDAATAAVINNFGSREQMVWFLPFAPDWSPTSTFLSHSFVHWLTRGLFLGFRRIYFNTQIDDMFLETDMYLPVNGTFTIDPTSIGMHIPWMADINKRMPAGSNYVLETGHNGNGNIETAVDINDNMTRPDICRPDGGIEYPDQVDTPLEFMKPPGTGTDIWPTNITEYKWSLECSQLDPLLQFWQNDTNFNAFYHISHTFTHEDEDNATYSDVTKEISWNVQWLQTVGFYDSDRFSPNGIIPPAITGLHNADALQAWADNGLKWVVGDNTRPVLMNPVCIFAFPKLPAQLTLIIDQSLLAAHYQRFREWLCRHLHYRPLGNYHLLQLRHACMHSGRMGRHVRRHQFLRSPSRSSPPSQLLALTWSSLGPVRPPFLPFPRFLVFPHSTIMLTVVHQLHVPPSQPPRL